MSKCIYDKSLLKDTVTVKKDEYTRVGEFVCPIGQLRTLGFNVNAGQMDSLGRAMADFKDGSNVDIEGTIRIYMHNSNDIPIGDPIFEGHTSELRRATAERTQQRVLAQRDLWIKENSKMVIFFKADEGSDGKIITKANSTMYLDGTLEIL